jgi:hypothetical protein
LGIGSFRNLLKRGPSAFHLSLFGNWFFWEFTQFGAQAFTSVPFWAIGSFGYRPYWVPRSLHLSPFGQLVLLGIYSVGGPGIYICPFLGNWFFWI